MTDAHLRDLERRWRETGALDDEARFVAELLRSGRATEAGLRLAVHLGDLASRAALGLSDSMPAVTQLGAEVLRSEDLAPWITGLLPWGKEALVRAALAAARLALPVYAKERPGDGYAREMCMAAEEWIAAPGARTLLGCSKLIRNHPGFARARYTLACTRLLEAVRADNAGVLASGLTFDEADHLGSELRQAGLTVEIEPGQARPNEPQHIVMHPPPAGRIQAIKTLQLHGGMRLEAAAAAAGTDVAASAVSAMRHVTDRLWAAEGLTPANVRAAIQADLIPWARGERDPVRERVAAR